MSTNNELYIRKTPEGKFEIHENMCVDNDFEYTNESLKETKDTLIEAIKWAKEYCNEYPYVEYGYSIDNSCLKEDSQKETKK